MIDKSARQYYANGQLVKPTRHGLRPGYRGDDRFGGHPGASHEGVGSGQTSGNQGSDRGNGHVHPGIASTYSAPAPAAPAAPQEERVSPIQSIAMVGDISLAGKTKTEADDEIAARNEAERVPDFVKQIITPPVTPRDDRVPDQIKDIITPPVTPKDKSDYKQFFTKPPLVEPKRNWLKTIAKLALQPFLPEPLQKAIQAMNLSTMAYDSGLTKTDVAKDFKENLESAFTSTGTSTGKSNIDTTERGEGRQFDKIPVQQAISKGEGLESGKKLLGLSEEEANYFKKLFASRDRKFLQSIFDKGTTRIQSGKATQKEKDVYTLLQQYLVDPKQGIMGVA